MKTTLIVIQNEADHADAKRLVEVLMGSSDPQDGARMVAQVRLVEAYERAQWPRTPPALPVLLSYLMDQPDWVLRR
jgi:HTH-type transcriptional regulator/antitoxin HigA